MLRTLMTLTAIMISSHVFAQNEAQNAEQPQQRTPSVDEQVGDWRFLCYEENNNKECGAIQVQVNEQKQRVMESRIVKVGEEKIGLLMIVPLGVNLQQGAAITIDGTVMGTVGYNVCTPEGCQALVTLNDPELNAMRRGNQATVTIVAGNNRVGVPISLKGFTASEKKVRGE
jgi:Invasion protein B, involved in pathogenesis